MTYDKQKARAEAEANGHSKQPLTRIIRDFCKECSGNSTREAELCTFTRCQLHPYRRGKNPFNNHSGGNPPLSTQRSKVVGRADGFRPQTGNG